MIESNYDFLIVGCGLFGATFANQAAKAGKRCLILDRRAYAAGNCHTRLWEDIHVHWHGAHIFHTSNPSVWDFVNGFAEFVPFINRPLANWHGELYNLPFNMNTFQQMWGITEPDEARKMIERQQNFSGTPTNLEEQAIRLVGTDIFEKLIRGYTEKQWGRKCSDLPAFIIERLPVRFTYDNNYFSDTYQGIPKNGYTAMVEAMTDGIDREMGVDYLSDKAEWDAIADMVVYTGAIDEYFGFCLGPLAYRGLRFETEVLNMPDYQSNAVVNYTDMETPYTRIIEHKHFLSQDGDKTVITKEYPLEWVPGMEPYYPVNDATNAELYGKYRRLAAEERHVVFGGRLGEYKYYDMDKVIEQAFATVAAAVNA